MKDTDKIINKTVDIIKKYYEHSKKKPVLKYRAPKELKKDIGLTIEKKGMNIDKLFGEIEKIALNSPKTNSK